MTASQQTNAGRDRVEVFNRLDQIVLSIQPAGEANVETQMTPADARRIAELLREAADTGERTLKS